MIYWRETINWIEHYDYSEGERIVIKNQKSFSNFISEFIMQTGLPEDFLFKVTSLKVSGCTIDTFNFLKTMPNLRKIYFLADKSYCWQSLCGTPKVQALSLHNLKSGKQYLENTSFLLTFPALKYLYVHLLGVSRLPEISLLSSLCAVEIEPRNENNIKDFFDFSDFEKAPALKVFNGCMAVDRHRVPAEAFIPILKNPSLQSFRYTQMYKTEDKKLQALIQKYHPSLLETSISYNEFLTILRKNFAF